MSMARYVLVADPTLSHEYRNFPLLDFLPCAPVNYVPVWLYGYLAGPTIPQEDGRARIAPYALRKIEAALLARYDSSEVVVAHPDYAHLFIDEDTRIIGVHTMDPVGLGPVTMMFTNGRTFTSLSELIFAKFMARLHLERMRRNRHAKIVVGGAGSWELTHAPDVVKQLHIDYVVQGEIDDVTADLFDQLGGGSLGKPFMFGYQTFDEHFHKYWFHDDSETFITRAPSEKQFPTLDEIPLIRSPSIKGLVEVMRGCGIGCDFCEVTLRPLRYYTPDMVKREIEVNLHASITNAWFHSDEIFAYGHGRNFEPNEDALVELFSAIMETGVYRANPTHARISVPAAYPDLLRRLSLILRSGPDSWVGVQVGLETGSDELAKKHIPNKILPLHIGPDGSWAEIVTEGLVNLNKYYWRPAFTVQVGQEGETPDDNWTTVGLINDLSNAGLEFTVTPLLNVPLGLLKTRREFYHVYDRLDEAQASVIYACFRHLQKMAYRNAGSVARGTALSRLALTQITSKGATAVLNALERMFRKKGFKMEGAKRHSLAEGDSPRPL